MSKFKVKNVRVSYPYLHKPGKADKDGNPGKYQATLMIPKDSAEHKEILAAMMSAAKEAAKEKFGDKIGNKFKWPIKDGDKPENWDAPKPEYAGHWIISCRSKDKPGIVDQLVKPITDESIPMAGDYINVTTSCGALEWEGSKGVTFYLNNVQFVKKGEPLGSRRRAEYEFDEIDVEDSGDFFSESEAEDEVPF